MDAISGWWNTGEPTENDGSPNRGYKVRPKGGYFPVAPNDHYVDLRDRMLTNLINAGFVLEKLPRGGHRRTGRDQLSVQLAAARRGRLAVEQKYIIKNTAWQNGKTVTFMPKPLFGDNGSDCTATNRRGRTAAR